MGPREPAARNAITIAIKADQTSGRRNLALLDEAVECGWQRHQGRLFLGLDPGNCARCLAR